MKITIEHKDTKISIEETYESKDRHASMKWKDENKAIQETIAVICDQIIKLQSSVK